MALCLSAASQNQTNNVTMLSQALKDKNWDNRSHAVEAISRLNDTRALDLLIEALSDQNSTVRTKAASALGKYNNTRVVQSLVQALKDNDSLVIEGSQRSLVKIGIPAVRPLILALKDNNSTIRANAAQTLGRIGDPMAVDSLSQLLMGNNSDVQTKAAYAIRKLKWKTQGTS